MLMTVKAIEQYDDKTAKISFVGKTNGTEYTSQIFLMVPWEDRKPYELGARYWMGINVHQKAEEKL